MTAHRILVTGGRNVPAGKAKQIERAIFQQGYQQYLTGRAVVVVHGAASGADRLARDAARRLGFDVEAHPADWAGQGKSAGPQRNQRMVDAGAAVCLAFPENASRGTWDCVRRAIEAGIPVVDGWTGDPIMSADRGQRRITTMWNEQRKDWCDIAAPSRECLEHGTTGCFDELVSAGRIKVLKAHVDGGDRSQDEPIEHDRTVP